MNSTIPVITANGKTTNVAIESLLRAHSWKPQKVVLPTQAERRAIITKGEAKVGNVSSLVDKSGILLFDRDLFHSDEDFWFVWLESAINLGYCKGFRFKK